MILLHALLVCEVEGEVVPLVEEGGEDSGEDLEVVVVASEDVGDVGEEGEEEGLTGLGLCSLVLCLCSGVHHQTTPVMCLTFVGGTTETDPTSCNMQWTPTIPLRVIFSSTCTCFLHH